MKWSRSTEILRFADVLREQGVLQLSLAGPPRRPGSRVYPLSTLSPSLWFHLISLSESNRASVEELKATSFSVLSTNLYPSQIGRLQSSAEVVPLGAGQGSHLQGETG